MDMTARDIIIENIRTLMAKKGLESENALAKKGKINQKTVNNLLNKDAFAGSPKLDTIERVAAALSTTPAELLTPHKTEHGIAEQKSTYNATPRYQKLIAALDALPAPLGEQTAEQLLMLILTLHPIPSDDPMVNHKQAQALAATATPPSRRR